MPRPDGSMPPTDIRVGRPLIAVECASHAPVRDPRMGAEWLAGDVPIETS